MPYVKNSSVEVTYFQHTVNNLLNARGVYLIFVLKGGECLIDTKRLLEGGVYFLSKVTHSNHYRNKLTALLNSNNFHTTFAINNKLLIDEVVYMLFILGKTSVMEKIISGIYVINTPLGGSLLDRAR